MFKKIVKYIICTFLIAGAFFYSFPSFVYFIYSDHAYSGNIINFVSMIATSLICVLTFRSVQQVIKSNKQNEESNQKNREINNLQIATEIFDKKFSLLLQEHKYYLGILSENYKYYIKNDEILKQPGFETLDLIRGEMKTTYYNNNKYIYLSGEIYISIKSILDNELLDGLFPSMPQIINTLKIKLLDINLNKNSHYRFISLKGNVLVGSNFNDYIKFEHSGNGIDFPSVLFSKIEPYLNDGITKKVKELLEKNNEFAKNTLSPYMRIIYHILKLSHEHAKQLIEIKDIGNKKEQEKLIKKEMKKNTNIIRSVIPNNILLLVAINSLFFYRNDRDKLYMFNDKDFIDQTDINNSKDFLEFAIFNDYKKYYNLLMTSDFFEHLYIDENENDYYINPESFFVLFNEKNTKRMHLDKGVMFHHSTNGMRISAFGLKNLFQFYKDTSNIFYLNNTKNLIYIFYKKNRSDITEMLTDNMNEAIRNQFKEKKIDLNKHTVTYYDKKEAELELYPDFAKFYMNGIIININ